MITRSSLQRSWKAGLFSAVLTAFVVVSITLLQPDNATLSTQLLSLIALQNGAPEDLQPFLSTTAGALPTSTTFRAGWSSVFVNALWFLGLILSLTAAFLGILAKQWCREYLRWHSVVESARVNVLLRQIRYEAWATWHVASYIAAIPVMLEIALISFFVGLLVFIPTLAQPSLTILLSIAISGALIGALVLIVLPIFYRLCPFQTSTGLSLLSTLVHARNAYAKLEALMLLGLSRIGPRDSGWFNKFRKRRQTTGRGRPGQRPDWRYRGLKFAESESCIRAIPGLVAACRKLTPAHTEWAILVGRDAFQTAVLMRALCWVRWGHNDGTVPTETVECISSIGDFTTRALQNPGSRYPPYFLSALHAICGADLSEVLAMLRVWAQPPRYATRRPSSQLRTTAGPFILLHHADPVGGQLTHDAMLSKWEWDPVSLPMHHALVRSRLLALVDQWVARANRPGASTSYLAEEISLLFCCLRAVPSHAAEETLRGVGTDLILPWVELLTVVYRKLAPFQEAYSQGLMSICLELARMLGPVTLINEGGEDSIEGMHLAALHIDRC